MKTKITFAAAGFAALVGAPAFADCSKSGTVVTCTGSDTNGYSSSTDSLTLTVQTSATVSNSDDAIRLKGLNGIVVNHGTVSVNTTSGGGDGIQADDKSGAQVTNYGSVQGSLDTTKTGDAIKVGDSASATNYGSLTGGDDGIQTGDGSVATNKSGATINVGDDGFSLGDNATAVNDGLITAGDDGVQGGAALQVTNSGTITATGKGIKADSADGVTVTNTGTITSATSEGIAANDNFTLTNRGTITANDDGVQINANALINNYGTIQSLNNPTDTQDGIDLDSGTINNYAGALIFSQYDSGIDFDAGTTSYINNAGTIRGASGIIVETGEIADHTTGLFATPNTAAQIITNSGLIEATGGPGEFAGYALYLGAGDDSATMQAGGRLIGAADFGADSDQLIFDGLFSGLFADGATMAGGAGTDTVSFNDYQFADLTQVKQVGSDFSLWFGSGFDAFRLTVNSWENFGFKDQTVSESRIAALAAVPLPAGGVLMLGGLGALALLRRRRRA
ncbi:MAG: beta strand repeat-containing protein [Cypionkella sp.]